MTKIMEKKSSFNSGIVSSIKDEKGLIVLGPTLAVFIILILLGVTLNRVMMNETAASANYLAEAKARQIAMTGLERAIQEFRNTRVPPSYTDVSFGTGTYTVRLDSVNDETGASLPWCNYVMIQSTGKIMDVERNVRVFLSSLPHAFLFPLYSQNLKGIDLDLASGSTVTGDVYYRGNIKSTTPISGVAYTPSGYSATTGSVTYHPDDQPPFPYVDESVFFNLLTTAANQSSGNLQVSNSTLNLSSYTNNTAYVNGAVQFTDATIVGPGTIVCTDVAQVNNSTVGDGIMFVVGADAQFTNFSTFGTSVCTPNDGVTVYTTGQAQITKTTFYGIVINTGVSIQLTDSSVYGAFISLGDKADLSNSTIVGSIVVKEEAIISSSTISRGSLPLNLNRSIGIEPYIIPGTWLEY